MVGVAKTAKISLSHLGVFIPFPLFRAAVALPPLPRPAKPPSGSSHPSPRLLTIPAELLSRSRRVPQGTSSLVRRTLYSFTDTADRIVSSVSSGILASGAVDVSVRGGTGVVRPYGALDGESFRLLSISDVGCFAFRDVVSVFFLFFSFLVR